jgi:hypothetical protein
MFNFKVKTGTGEHHITKADYEYAVKQWEKYRYVTRDLGTKVTLWQYTANGEWQDITPSLDKSHLRQFQIYDDI